MPARYTRINLGRVEDAAPANGFGERWEARVARTDLGAEQAGLTHFRLRPGKGSPFVHRHRERAFEAGPDGLEFIAFGPHRADGEPVADEWVD